MPRALAVSSRIFFTLSTLSAIAALIGCGGSIPTGPSCSGGGFTVHVGDVNANGVYSGDAAAGQAYGNFLSGSGYTGCVGSFGSASDFLNTPYTVANGYAPATWSGAWKAWCTNQSGNDPGGLSWEIEVQLGDPTNQNGGGPLNLLGTCATPAAQSFFQLSGSLPSTLTIPGSGLTNTYGCPSIRAKALSRTNFSCRCFEHRLFAREVEDQDSGNLTLNHPAVEDRSIKIQIVPPTIDSA